MFGGLEPDEYRELQDYYKSFGGIEPLSVNKNITTEDVLRATGPLSQPVGPDLTSTVAQFNQFLGSILGAKSQRIADEKEAVQKQDQQVREAVDKFLVADDPKKNLMVVNDQIVDVSTLGTDDQKSYDFRTEEDSEPATIKLTGGVEMTVERFEGLDQDQKNKLLGLDTVSGEQFKQIIYEKDGGVSVLFEKDGELNTKRLDNIEIAPKDEDQQTRLINREAELRVKQKSEEGLTDLETAELENIQKVLFDKPFETSAEKEWGVESTKLILSGPDRFESLTEVARVVNQLNQAETRTGLLTPPLTFLQELVDPFGVDLKFLTDLFGLDVLNDPTASATIDALSNRFGIALSEGLKGNISNKEIDVLLNSTIKLGRPKDFNRNFAEGLLYLTEKSVFEAEAAEKASTAQEWAAMVRDYIEKNPPPTFMQPYYDYQAIVDMSLGIEDKLNLSVPDLEDPIK